MSKCFFWLAHYKNIHFYIIQKLNFEIITCFLDYDRDCSGKSRPTHVHNGNYWLQKIDNSHDHGNWHIWPSSQYNNFCPIKFKCYFVFGSYKNPQTLNSIVLPYAGPYVKTRIMALEYFFHYSLQLFDAKILIQRLSLSVFLKLRHSDTCNQVESCTKHDRPD